MPELKKSTQDQVKAEALELAAVATRAEEQTQDGPEPPPALIFGVTTIAMIKGSDANPRKTGIYVETAIRTGKINPGPQYRVTDGLGNFWWVPGTNAEVRNPDPAEGKYLVRKADGAPADPLGIYLVLKLNSEKPSHASAARDAARTLREKIRTADPRCAAVVSGLLEDAMTTRAYAHYTRRGPQPGEDRAGSRV